MRTKLTNLILHTTALISRRKNQLIVSHAYISIFNNIVIIFLEIFLAIISIPLYIFYGNSDGKNKAKQRITQLIFLIILIVFFAVGVKWCLSRLN